MSHVCELVRRAQVDRENRYWERTIEYKKWKEMKRRDWEQVDRKIRKWGMTMEYDNGI